MKTVNVFLNQASDANRRTWFEAESDAIPMATNVEELKGNLVTFYGDTAEQALASLIKHLKAKGMTGKVHLANKVKIDRTKLAELVSPRDDAALLPRADWQTKARGSNSNEYDIYCACAGSLGWKVKTYDQWMNS